MDRLPRRYCHLIIVRIILTILIDTYDPNNCRATTPLLTTPQCSTPSTTALSPCSLGIPRGMLLVRVNTLSPRYIRTSGGEEERLKKKSGLETQWVGENMLLRLSTVNEYRAPVVFMLGGGSSYMTGADLRADGGHCAW